jgi:hypothetical protein
MCWNDYGECGLHEQEGIRLILNDLCFAMGISMGILESIKNILGITLS